MMGINMALFILVGGVFITSVNCSVGEFCQPKDVIDFQEKAEQCQYLSGEWDSSLTSARKKELETQTNIVCGEISAKKKHLLEKYESNNEVKKIIDAYDF
jgi:hypothetical protein